MRIYYNVTGERRKSLVGAISQELNTQVKYLGAPTFAYEVGGYTIDKNGELEGEDNSELVADLCGLHDFRAETEEYDTPLPAAVPVPADAPIPMEAALGGRVSPYRDEEEPPAYGHPGDDEPDHLIIEIPLEGFTDTALENLDRLISSKAALIKKAIGTDALPVERTETMLKFPWFRFGATSEEVDAYSRLVCALCAAAKEQKRVNAKEKPWRMRNSPSACSSSGWDSWVTSSRLPGKFCLRAFPATAPSRTARRQNLPKRQLQISENPERRGCMAWNRIA